MIRSVAFTAVAAFGLASTTSGFAQSDNVAQGQERSSFVQEFKDPGNSEAKAVAEREGISIGEATKRLRLERQAANLLYRLNRKGLADDVFAKIEDGKLVHAKRHHRQALMVKSKLRSIVISAGMSFGRA